MAVFTIDLNEAPEKALHRIGVANIQDSLSRSNDVRDQLRQAALNRASAEGDLEKRKKQFDRASTIRSLKLERYEASLRIERALEDQVESTIRGVRIATREEADLKASLSFLEAKISGVQDIYSESAIETKLLLLQSLSDAIDFSFPISYTTGATSARVCWQTTPISIKDGLGGWTETTFGPFYVEISFHMSSGTSYAEVECRSIEHNYDYEEDDDEDDPDNGHNVVHHPHISGLNVCLGNAQGMLLEALKGGDVAGAISIFTDFLQTYNKADPYKALSEWEANGHDNAVCEDTGQLVSTVESYPENACTSCGQDSLALSGCGHCPTCCLKYHVDDPGSDGIGINGTRCIERRLYSISRSLEEEVNNG